MLVNVRLCVVGLAPSHAVFKANISVTSVDFNVGKSSRANIKAAGKRKKVKRRCYNGYTVNKGA